MSVDRTSDRPVYKQVADALRAAIRGGELADGALLASETELMERYGVSRSSVRNAVAPLRVEGLVVTERSRARSRRCCAAAGLLVTCTIVPRRTDADA
ncbi:MAG: GntR family transcriptional regulator [Egibacteraceae bacterium]